MVIYENACQGIFLARPNRFIAQVEIRGRVETVHVKNTGRCRELLRPGAEVWCQEFDKQERKTKFDLYAVRKGQRLVNMDSQAPNKAAGEWLAGGGLGLLQDLRPETTHGDSSLIFPLRRGGSPVFWRSRA